MIQQRKIQSFSNNFIMDKKSYFENWIPFSISTW